MYKNIGNCNTADGKEFSGRWKWRKYAINTSHYV